MPLRLALVFVTNRLMRWNAMPETVGVTTYVPLGCDEIRASNGCARTG